MFLLIQVIFTYREKKKKNRKERKKKRERKENRVGIFSLPLEQHTEQI